MNKSSKEIKSERSTKSTSHHQMIKWQKRFEELVEFQKINKHCIVPNNYAPNPELSRWVKRQRHQYNILQQEKLSPITIQRIKSLNEIGFTWDAHESFWQERIKSLIKFKEEHGHCEVPSRYGANTQLAIWVKSQRRQYKLYKENSPSDMTKERFMELEKHGFTWMLRRTKSYKKTSSEKESDVLNDILSIDSCCLSLFDTLSQAELSARLSKLTSVEHINHPKSRSNDHIDIIEEMSFSSLSDLSSSESLSTLFDEE